MRFSICLETKELLDFQAAHFNPQCRRFELVSTALPRLDRFYFLGSDGSLKFLIFYLPSI
jgi:hypothetical protein